MALTTIGLNTLSFGTTAVGSAIVSSYEETISSEPVELMGGNGTFSAVAFANPQANISMTIIQGSTSYGGVGALVTTATGSSSLVGLPTALHVDSVQVTAKNDGFTETTLTLQGWNNLGSSS